MGYLVVEMDSEELCGLSHMVVAHTKVQKLYFLMDGCLHVYPLETGPK